ncbi:predicted protein [Chaetoceros tenuissimus]|uniref:Uncharacterized protein n=1 Tax=Chaetoceros tenuissimus TaxID=426638 RepID=A0AAD3CS51_9STRA|nr:predicted protein [Chaetoceros tenuissimus]
MHKDEKTLFYNGEKLFDEENHLEYLIYDEEERDSWEVIFVLPGVQVIRFYTFNGCSNIETVIMADTVRRIEEDSFYYVLQESRIYSTLKKFGIYWRVDFLGEVNTWIKNRLQGDEFTLYRACSSYNPLEEVIYGIVKRHGPKAFKEPDSIGITPVQYLEQTPFDDIDQQKLMKRYILDMMGEIVN